MDPATIGRTALAVGFAVGVVGVLALFARSSRQQLRRTRRGRQLTVYFDLGLGLLALALVAIMATFVTLVV